MLYLSRRKYVWLSCGLHVRYRFFFFFRISVEEKLFLGAQFTTFVYQFNDKWKNNDVNIFTNFKRKEFLLLAL